MAFDIKERFKDDKKLPTRYYSTKQEKQVAKIANGTTTANSGATMFGGKGDVLTSGSSMLIECKTKTTHSNSISIKKEWIDKNRQEQAFMGKKYNCIAFNFGPNEENFYIIDEYLFQSLLEYLETSNSTTEVTN